MAVKINPYLNFDGTAEEAMNFYKKVFGGDFAVLQRFKDIPPAEGQPQPSEDEKNRIMHIALPVGEYMLMASDIAPSMGHKLTMGNNVYISLGPDTKEEGERLFNELSEGAKNIEMQWGKMFWGGWFGAFTDKFGVMWMINYQEDEMPGTTPMKNK